MGTPERNTSRQRHCTWVMPAGLVGTVGHIATSVLAPSRTARSMGFLHKNIRRITSRRWKMAGHIHLSDPQKEEQHCVSSLWGQKGKGCQGLERDKIRNDPCPVHCGVLPPPCAPAGLHSSFQSRCFWTPLVSHKISKSWHCCALWYKSWKFPFFILMHICEIVSQCLVCCMRKCENSLLVPSQQAALLLPLLHPWSRTCPPHQQQQASLAQPPLSIWREIHSFSCFLIFWAIPPQMWCPV